MSWHNERMQFSLTL